MSRNGRERSFSYEWPTLMLPAPFTGAGDCRQGDRKAEAFPLDASGETALALVVLGPLWATARAATPATTSAKPAATAAGLRHFRKFSLRLT